MADEIIDDTSSDGDDGTAAAIEALEKGFADDGTGGGEEIEETPEGEEIDDAAPEGGKGEEDEEAPPEADDGKAPPDDAEAAHAALVARYAALSGAAPPQAGGAPAAPKPPAQPPSTPPTDEPEWVRPIVSDEDLAAIEEEVSEPVAKVFRAIKERDAKRGEVLNQLVSHIHTRDRETLLERMGEVRSFFDGLPADLKAQYGSGKQFSEQQDRLRASAIRAAMRIKQDEAAHGEHITITRALQVAIDAIHGEARRKSAKDEARKEIEGRVVKRHRQRDLVPSAGRRAASDQDEDMSAARAIQAVARKKGVNLSM